jgi:hypothetical protein
MNTDDPIRLVSFATRHAQRPPNPLHEPGFSELRTAHFFSAFCLQFDVGRSMFPTA